MDVGRHKRLVEFPSDGCDDSFLGLGIEIPVHQTQMRRELGVLFSLEDGPRRPIGLHKGWRFRGANEQTSKIIIEIFDGRQHDFERADTRGELLRLRRQFFFVAHQVSDQRHVRRKDGCCVLMAKLSDHLAQFAGDFSVRR